MDTRRRTRMFLFAYLLLAVCLTLCACSGGSPSAAAGDDGVLKRPAGGVAPDSDGPAFVMIEDIRYDNNETLYENREPRLRGTPYSVAEYSLDEFGNCTLFEKTMRDNAVTYAFAEEFVDPGLGLNCTSTPAVGFPEDLASELPSNNNVLEGFDKSRVFSLDGGRVAQCVRGDILVQFEYYPSGRMKSVHHRNANGQRLSSLHGGGESRYAYFDEAGYVTSTDMWGPFIFTYSSPREYKWEFDDNGFPVAYTMTTDNRYRTKSESPEQRYTLDTDEYGNITAIYRDAESGRGALLRRMAYKRVDRPSYWVRQYAAGVFQW